MSAARRPALRESRPDLEVDEDLGFDLRQSKIQRAAWWVALVVIGLALLGLFGSGPLDDSTVADPGRVLTVDYHRFPRRLLKHTLRVRVEPRGGPLRLWIDDLASHDVNSIVPRPIAETVDGDRVIFDFDPSPVTAAKEIELNLETEQYGPRTVRVGLVGGPEVEFFQLVYP
jgi:hypothetical protein